MEYRLWKSGLEIFDAARAYGLAQLVQVLLEGQSAPQIADLGCYYNVAVSTELQPVDLSNSDLWRAVFAEVNWQRVFLTYKTAWSRQRDAVQKCLQRNTGDLLGLAADEGLAVDFAGKASLPGPLDPAGFKGLKGLTTGSYSEGQTGVDEFNWALGCLGGAIAQRYKVQKVVGNKWEYYVTLPVPDQVRFDDFHKVRALVYDTPLRYAGVRNAAAHFAVLLADAVRKEADGNPFFLARFSGVLYFSLFQSGQQFKPSVGGLLSVADLVEKALTRSEEFAEVFETWRYLFRRGSTRGADDLAHAITELVMNPTLETYYRHARVFNRYIVDRSKGVKPAYLYTERALREVIDHVQF